MIVTRLEEYDYSGAAAIACVILAISFAVLLPLNVVQHWQRRRIGMSAAGLREPLAAKIALIAAAMAYVPLMLLLPLGAVFVEAFQKGGTGFSNQRSGFARIHHPYPVRCSDRGSA